MNNQSILITGCSSGIGLCAATILKNRGYRVFAAARKGEDVAKLLALGFESLELDVNDANSMRHAVAQILDLTGGKLDALFNNAGYLQAGAIEDLSLELMRAQFETNVFGPMELIRLVLPTMRKQGHGRIIQNSSILGIVTLPYYGAYNASKFALEGFTNTLRQELYNTHIHVSLINPGATTSNLRANAFEYYQATVKEKAADSFYNQAYDHMEQHYFKRKGKNKFAKGPESVVKELIHALESSHPKSHYYVGFTTKLTVLLHSLLPDAVMDWFLSKVK